MSHAFSEDFHGPGRIIAVLLLHDKDWRSDMVSKKSVVEQLKKIGFKHEAWGRGEVRELHNILIPDEEIVECVNGIYEGGFALLVATNVRVLLIDKKPLNYLT